MKKKPRSCVCVERLLEQLLSIPGVRLNGSPTQRIPHTLSLTFSEGEFNPAALSASIAFSATSACNSASNAPSHVLLALGHDARIGEPHHSLEPGPFHHRAGYRPSGTTDQIGLRQCSGILGNRAMKAPTLIGTQQ